MHKQIRCEKLELFILFVGIVFEFSDSTGTGVRLVKRVPSDTVLLRVEIGQIEMKLKSNEQ